LRSNRRVFEHGLRGHAPISGLFAFGAPRATSYGVGAFWGPVQFALIEPAKVGAAIRSRPLQPTRSRCTLFPSLRARKPGAALLLPARRRLSAPWMLTPRTPSFHNGAGRAFTENDPTSDTSLSLRSTGASAPSVRPPALAPRATLERAKSSITARARIVPPSPRT